MLKLQPKFSCPLWPRARISKSLCQCCSQLSSVRSFCDVGGTSRRRADSASVAVESSAVTASRISVSAAETGHFKTCYVLFVVLVNVFQLEKTDFRVTSASVVVVNLS